MKLYDEQSVTIVYENLKDIIETERDNGNMLYNAVVVLGTWMRILPPPFEDTRASIRQDLEKLRTDLQQDEANWRKTLKLIGEMTGT